MRKEFLHDNRIRLGFGVLLGLSKNRSSRGLGSV